MIAKLLINQIFTNSSKLMGNQKNVLFKMI